MANGWLSTTPPVLWFFSDAGDGIALRYALEDRGVTIAKPESGECTVLPTHAALMLTQPGRETTSWKRIMFSRFANSLEIKADLPLTEQLDMVMDFLHRDGPPPCEQMYGGAGDEQQAAVM